ncbi:hypothetical protein D3C76_1746240 [compost metagenome]
MPVTQHQQIESRDDVLRLFVIVLGFLEIERLADKEFIQLIIGQGQQQYVI